jgi:outer membrane protein
MKSIFTFILLIFNVLVFSQQADSVLRISLQDAYNLALQNNLTVKNALIDIEIAKKKVWETTAIGLPQVSGKVEYQNMPDIPTQMMPDFLTPSIVGVNKNLFGLDPTSEIPTAQSFPVQFGTKHNASYGLTISQLVFSGEYIVGLQASRTYKQLSERALAQTQKEIEKSVAQAYFQVLVAEENVKIIIQSSEVIEKSLFESEQMYLAGFLEDTDVDQLRLTLSNLKNTLLTLNLMKQVAYKLLNFNLGLNINQKIEIKDDLKFIIALANSEAIIQKNFDFNKNLDYKLLQTSYALSTLSLKREKSTVLPTLAAFLSWNKSSMGQEFNFFSSQAEWYPSTIIGLSLSIPIFASGTRWSKIEQAQMEVNKSANSLKLLEQQLNIAYFQTKSTFETSFNKYEIEKQNLEISKKIYDKTVIKYKEGVSSSFELAQNHTQYLTTQSNYFNAILDYLNSYIAMRNLLKE